MNTKQDNIIRTDYAEIMQKSYIDYAMSVIISRALPDVRDGLKPVQRRTLYDMYDQVAFVGGVDEYRAAVVLFAARRTVEDADRDDPVAPLLDVARFGVELAARQDRNASGAGFGEHPCEGLRRHRRFEMVSVAAIAHLLRIGSVFFRVVGLVQHDEAGEQARRGASRGDVRGAQSVDRESADVVRAFEDDAVFPFARGGDGGGDPRRGSAHDHHVVGVRPRSGREGQQQ